MDQLTIATRDLDGWVVVEAAGEIDTHTAPILRQALGDQIGAGHTALIVDLSRVGFIDSSGLGVLIGALRRIRETEGQLKLVTGVEATLKLLRVTGLQSVFDIQPSIQHAASR